METVTFETIPQVAAKINGGNAFQISYDTSISLLNCGDWGNQYAELLQNEIAAVTGFCPAISNMPAEKTIALSCDTRITDESYVIKITEKSVIITGARAGVLYGVQTLRQLVRLYGADLPCVDIDDRPDIPVRGFYHDTTRGRVPTLDFLKRLADKCAFYKLNQLQLYVEHSFVFKGERTIGTPLTAGEITEFDEYCRNLCIELVPSLASFGHLYELLRTPEFSKYCELDGTENKPFSFCDRMEHHTVAVAVDGSEQLMCRRIGEYMKLFSSDKFNICADETFDLCKGKSREYGEENGLENAYCHFLKKLCDYVEANGKKPMFWGDYLLKNPSFISRLPADSVVLDWNYEPDAKDDSVSKFISSGVKNLYICPGIQGWNHLIYQHRDAYKNISAICSYARKHSVQGILSTDWGDYGHVNHPEALVQGLIYSADMSWNQNRIGNEDALNSALSFIEYSDATRSLAEIFACLSEQEYFRWYTLIKCKETMDDAQRTECFKKYPEDKAAEKNAETGRLIQQLKSLETYSNSEIIQSYIVSAQGQSLLNLLPSVMLSNNTAEKLELADKLKKWFREFTKMWMKVSKTSELYRVKQAIDWYLVVLSEKNR